MTWTSRISASTIDADGIALATWDMPGRSMNVITAEVMDELSRIVETVAGDAAIKGCVITSGKDSFLGRRRPRHAAGPRRALRDAAKDEGEEEAMQRLLRGDRASCRCSIAGSRPAASRSPPPSTASASAAPSNSRSPAITASSSDDRRDPRRPARGQGRAVSRRRRHAARGAPDADRRRAADAVQGRADPRRRPRKAWASCMRSRPRAEIVDARQGVDRSGGSARRALGREGFRLPVAARSIRPAGMMIWPPANAIYRRETQDNYPAAKAILHAVYRGPAAADGSRAQGRESR